MTPPPAADLPEQYRTRSETPMIGPYSTHQMDDFYAALARGEAKPSGIMNLYQHLYIAQRCAPGAKVLDVCCGRGLALPLLHRYAAHIGRYIGVDISSENLREAHERAAALGEIYHEPFPVELVECDVAEPWPQLPLFDVALYTSALEHLPFELGARSLHRTAHALAPGGTLYLSTPNSPGPAPKPLQHRVHVYEWSAQEVLDVLAETGLRVREVIGLIPPEPDQVAAALTDRYGAGAAHWYRDLAARIPAALLDVVAAAMEPSGAHELLFVCDKPL
jgi:SAM-dependent methyltransferase